MVELKLDSPNIEDICLPHAFSALTHLDTASLRWNRESRVDMGLLSDLDSITRFKSGTTVYCIDNYHKFDMMPNTVRHVFVADNCCNQESIQEWLLASWKQLVTLSVGNYCFKHCSWLKLKSLRHLASLTVGTHSFTEVAEESIKAEDIGRRDSGLGIMYCPSLVSIKIGPLSFADASACVIESNT